MNKITVSYKDAEECKRVLLGCGIFPSRKGFGYLIQAIDSFRRRGIGVCEIYQEVGKVYGVRPENVERCIRSCMEEAAEKDMVKYLNELFHLPLVESDHYVSNGDFIAIVSTHLDLIGAPFVTIL